MPDNKDSILNKIRSGQAKEVVDPASDVLSKIKSGQAVEITGAPVDPAKKKDIGGPSASSPRPTPLVSDGGEDLLSKGTFGLVSGLPRQTPGVATYSVVAGPEAERMVADKLAASGADERQLRTGLGIFKSGEDPVASFAKAAIYDAQTRKFRDSQRAAAGEAMEQSGALDRLVAASIPATPEMVPATQVPSQLEMDARRAQRAPQDVLTQSRVLEQSQDVVGTENTKTEEEMVEAERPTYFQTGSVADLYRAENQLAEDFLGQKLPAEILAVREQKSKEMDAAVNVMDSLTPTDQAKFVSDLEEAIAQGQNTVDQSDDPEMGIDREDARTKLAYLKELRNYAQQKYDRYAEPVIDNFIRGYRKEIEKGRLDGQYVPSFEFDPINNIMARVAPNTAFYTFTASPDAEFRVEQQDKIRDDIEAFIANNPKGAYLNARDKNFIVQEILNSYQVQGKIQNDLINKFETEGGLSPKERAVFRAGNLIAGVGDEWGEVANQVADYRRQLIAANPAYSDPTPQQAAELDQALAKFQQQQVLQKVKQLEASLGGESMREMTPEEISSVVNRYNQYVNEPDASGQSRFQQIVGTLQDERQRANAEKYAGQNWAEKGADHFINGMDNVMVMMGNALYSSGLEGLGSHFRDPYMAERMDANAYKTPTITWDQVQKGEANPLYYILEQAGEQLPFSLIGGAAAKMGGTVLGEFAGGLLGRKLSEGALKTLAGGSAALNETFMNMGDTYYQMAVGSGVAPEKAREIARQQASKEALMNIVLDRIEYAPFYSEYKNVLRPAMGRAAGRAAATVGTQQLVQGAQEVGQGYLQQEGVARGRGEEPMTLGEYIASADAKENFFGAFAGAMPQSVTAAVTEAYNNQQNWQKLSESALQIQPNVFKGILDGMIVEGRPDRAKAMLNSYLADAQRIANDPAESRERRAEASQSVRTLMGDISYVDAYWKEASKLTQTENKPLSQMNARERYGLQLMAASDAIRAGIPEVYAERSGVDLANEKRANTLRDTGIDLINGEGAVYEMQDANGRSVFMNANKMALLVQRPEFKQLVNDGIITGINVIGDPGVQQIVSANTQGLEFKAPKRAPGITVIPSVQAADIVTVPAEQPVAEQGITVMTPEEARLPDRQVVTVGEEPLSSEPAEAAIPVQPSITVQQPSQQPVAESVQTENITIQTPQTTEDATQVSEPLQMPREGLSVQEQSSQQQYQGIDGSQQVQEQLRETGPQADSGNRPIGGTQEGQVARRAAERTLADVAISLGGGVRQYTPADVERAVIDFNAIPAEKRRALRRVANAVKAISAIAPEAKVIVTNNEDAFTDLYTKASNRDEGGEVVPVSANGFYNPVENTIVLNTSNEDFTTDTVFHESIHPVISHIASRNPQLVDAMYEELSADPELNEVFVRRFASRYGSRADRSVREEAIIEFLARQAANRTWTQRIGDWITRFLQKIGLSQNQISELDLTKSDGIRSMAASLSNALQRGMQIRMVVPQAPDPETLGEFNEQGDTAVEVAGASSVPRLQISKQTREERQQAREQVIQKQADLDAVLAFQQNVLDGKVNVKGKTAEQVVREINDRVRQLSEEIADLTSQSQFTVAEQTLKDRVKQKVIDRYARLLDYKKGLEETGYNFNVSNDFYAGADLWRPRAYEKIKQLSHQIGFDKYRPDSLFGRMNKAGIDFTEFGNYLYALHAPERNAYNRELSQARVDTAIETLMEERQSATNDYQRADIDRQIEDINEGRDQDFKVIEAGSGMTDQEAQDIIDQVAADPDKNRTFEQYEEEFRREVIDPILTTKRNYGLIDEDEFEALANGRYKKYIPLKVNESFFTGDDQFKDAVLFPQKNIRLTKGIFRSKGAENIKAESRNNPIIQAIIDLQDDIMKGEANRYRGQIAQAVKDNPNKKVWSIKTAQYDYKKGSDGKNIPVAERAVPKNGIEFYDNGKKKYIIIEEGPLLDAIKETNVSSAVPVLSHINKWMRNINTVYNPEFWMTNLIRDIQEAGLALGREDIKGLQRKFLSNIKNPKLYKGIFLKEGGDASTEMGQWAQRYADNGGEFSGYTMNSQEEMFKNVERAYNKYSKSGIAEDGRRAAIKLGEYWNRTASTVELASRVSAFKALVESGVPEYKAAEIARNLTVNFDKKGEWGSTINSLYLFANAGIQGTTNLLYGIMTKPRYKYIAAGVAALGALEVISNDMLSDCEGDPEDCYDAVREDTKNKNIMIKNPAGKGFLKIPIPYGWSFFHALGVQGAQAARGKRTATEAVTGSTTAFLESFNPIQSDDLLQALSPTAFDPIVQLATNTNWMGGKIKPDQIYKSKPESQLAFSNTTTASRKVAEALNEWTGGSEKARGAIDISPAVLDYIFDTGTGGTGRTVLGVGGLFTGRVSEQGVKAIPFLRKFYEAPPRLVNLGELYDMKDEAPRTKFTPYEVNRFKDRVERAFGAGEIDAKQRKEFLDVMHRTQSVEYAKHYEERLNKLMEGITTQRYPDKTQYDNKVAAAKRKATEYAKRKTKTLRGE